jgi:hypothetical protein
MTGFFSKEYNIISKNFKTWKLFGRKFLNKNFSFIKLLLIIKILRYFNTFLFQKTFTKISNKLIL